MYANRFRKHEKEEKREEQACFGRMWNLFSSIRKGQMREVVKKWLDVMGFSSKKHKEQRRFDGIIVTR